jgi:hypothetical protein
MTPARLEWLCVLVALAMAALLVVFLSGCIAPPSGALGPDKDFLDALPPVC